MDVRTARDALLLQTDRLQTLNEIGRAVSSTLELGSLYEMIYDEVNRLMDTTQFYVAIHRPDRGLIEIPYHREGGSLHLGQTVAFGGNVTSLVIERGEPLLFCEHADY